MLIKSEISANKNFVERTYTSITQNKANMMKVRYLWIISILWISCLKVSGQNPLLDSLKQVIASSDNLNDKLLAVNSIVNYGINNDLDLAKQYIEFGLQEATEKGNDEYIVKFLYGKMLHFFLTGNLDSSLIIGTKGKDLTQKGSFEKYFPQFLNLEANIYTQQLDFDKATKTYLDGYKAFLQKGDTLNMGAMSAGLGYVYAYQDTIPLAIQYYEQAIALYEAADAPPSMILPNYGNLAQLYEEEDEKALTYAQKLLEVATEINSTRYMAEAYLRIGFLNSRKGNNEEAIINYEKALELNINAQDSISFFQAKGVLGGLYLEMGNKEAAKQQLEPVVAFFRRKGSSKEMREPLSALATVYNENGNYKKAYEYLSESSVIAEELYNESKLQTSTEQEAIYKNQENEIALANQRLEITQQKNIRNIALLGALILILAAFSLFQYLSRQRKQKQKEAELALSIKQAEATQLKELDQIKSNFFANISHEFRTPLTLIISPLKEIVNGTFKGNLITYHQIMLRNGERLLRLINQLLDLSKLEANKLDLKLETYDLTQFIKQLAGAFTSYAETKQIDFSMEVPAEPLLANIDPDKFEKVINNLLSNALKFTPEEGRVQIKLKNNKQKAIIEISDTGIGINKKDLPHVFDRFYQVDAEVNRGFEGSGIGLALAKELVELHDGTIRVDSKVGEGSVFRVEWPLLEQEVNTIEQEVIRISSPETILPSPEEAMTLGSNPKMEKVLVVEDNDDVRFYITDKLKDQFEILEAANGKIGLKIAIDQVPDLIISDVMMPVMDGNQLSTQLRAKAETSHIPIIMLTAKSDMDSKLEGLRTGVDDYLTKPIDSRELLVRIDNLLEQRKQLRAKYAKELVLSTQQEVEKMENPEDQFMAKIMQIVGDHLEDESFGVEELAKAMLLSRYQLLRKIKALTGKSVSVFIRWVRLNRAKELLEQKQGNVSEVAFRLGFNSIAYFSKCFKEEFGETPSSYLVKT